MPTNVQEFLGDLDGGVFDQKLSRALAAAGQTVAAGVIEHGRAGKVQITFDLKQIANSHQVTIDHKLVYVLPTSRGKLSEENTTQTPMHVGKGGKLSLFPENQTQMFTKQGDVVESQ